MKNLKYSAGIVSQSFWFNEFRQYLRLVKDGYQDEEIKNKILRENLFGAPNETRIKRMYGYISRRVKELDEELLNLFFCSDFETQKIINLIVILKNDRLFFEFLYEVYREKIIIGDFVLCSIDINTFFNYKETQDSFIENLTESTKRRIQSSFLNFMAEANLLRVENKEKLITPPLLDISLESYLKQNGEAALFKAISGEC